MNHKAFSIGNLFFRKTDDHARHEGKPHGKIDSMYVGIILILLVVGIVMVYNASVAIAIRDFSDQYYYVREQ